MRVIEAELDATEPPEPETQTSSEIPAARQNLIDYLAWMFPNKQFEDMYKLGDEEAAAIAAAVKSAADQYVSSLKPAKKRRSVRPALEYADLWLQGNSIPEIAVLMNKNDGTIRLSLAPFAEKIGKSVTLDELLEQAAEDPS